MRWMTHLLVIGMTAAIFGGIALMLFIQYYARDLPDFKQLENYNPPHLTRFYSADGKVLEEYATEARLFVPISSIPLRLRQAFLSAEDRNFYQHSGIDFTGIFRAIVTNISNAGRGRPMVGGSTIAQQVVKNFLLTNEQSFDLKIKEAILAFRISSVFSKDKILELYLNEIYLGSSAYGVAQAALTYFNRSIDELSIEESAFLAMLPKAPSQFSPRRNYTRALERRNYVIDRMYDEGYITSEEGERAKATPIILRERDEAETTSAPSFAEEVRRQIVHDYGADALYQGGLTVHTTLEPKYQKMAEIALLRGIMMYDRRHGWRGPLTRLPTTKSWLRQLVEVPKPTGLHRWSRAVVLSANDGEAQIGLENGGRGFIKQADVAWTGAKHVGDALKHGDVIMVEKADQPDVPAPDAKEPPKEKEKDPKEMTEDDRGTGTPVHYELRQIPEVDGALVVMDPHTGRVLAMVGGLGFRNAEYNRATQAKRQPGSSFKPFIYLAAMEKGYTPITVVNDSPIYLSQGAGLPMWSPQNYSGGFMGPMTLRSALEKSRNVVTVRLVQMLGLDKVLEVGKRFGIYDELPKNYSIVLGSAETTLIRLARAFAILDNGGKKVEPILIDRIADRHGKFIYRSDTRACSGCVQNDTHQVSDTVPVLEDTREQLTDPISAYQIVSILEGVVQRGTSTRAKVLGKPVAGKTGTTNNSIDSWFNGFSPDLVASVFVGFDRPHTLGAKETGGSVALPCWVEFMKMALADKPSTPFRIPPGVRLMRVDAANGKPPTASTPTDRIIFEAFKPNPVTPVVDQEEGGEHTPIPAEGAGIPYAPSPPPAYVPPASVPPAQPNVPRRPPTLGTGGLY